MDVAIRFIAMPTVANGSGGVITQPPTLHRLSLAG
jgi:hypothetical protein